MAADDDPLSQLSPADRAYLLGGKQQGAPAAAAPATSSAPAAAPSATSTTPAPPPGGYSVFNPDPSGAQHAVETGFGQGLQTVLNAPADWINRATGYTPYHLATPLTPAEQAGQEAHPVWTGVGRFGGEALGAAPVVMAGEAALPAMAGIGAAAPVVRGAIMGAGQNALTSAGSPDQPIAGQMATGAALGGVGGWLGGRIGRMFGSDAALASPAVQDAGNTAQQAGIKVLPENLPRAGGPGLATGAAANTEQTGQINQAFGKLLGASKPTPDFTPQTLQPAIASAGQNVGNAAAAGQIDWANVEPALVKIGAQTSDSRVHALINDVMNEVDPTSNQIPGSSFQQLIRHNSDLDRATRSQIADLAEPAQQIEQALSAGFSQSSAPGVAAAYSDARLNYKLWLAVENNVRSTGGQINPATMLGTMTRWLPDTPRLGAPGTGTADQFADLARSVHTLFGSGQGASGAAAATGGWLSQHPVIAGALGAGGLGGVYQAATNPAAIGQASNWLAAHIPVVGLGAAALGARDVLSRAGAAYQRSPAFVNALLQRGTQQAANPLAAYGGAVAAALPPDRQPSRP